MGPLDLAGADVMGAGGGFAGVVGAIAILPGNLGVRIVRQGFSSVSTSTFFPAFGLFLFSLFHILHRQPLPLVIRNHRPLVVAKLSLLARLAQHVHHGIITIHGGIDDRHFLKPGVGTSEN